MDTFDELPAVEPVSTVAEEPAKEPEGPKLTCDVTIVVRDGELKALKVRSMGDITYNQLKEVCTAGAQRVDVEFTNRCKELNAMLYKPAAE